jgi:hypothetical protein
MALAYILRLRILHLCVQEKIKLLETLAGECGKTLYTFPFLSSIALPSPIWVQEKKCKALPAALTLLTLNSLPHRAGNCTCRAPSEKKLQHTHTHARMRHVILACTIFVAVLYYWLFVTICFRIFCFCLAWLAVSRCSGHRQPEAGQLDG